MRAPHHSPYPEVTTAVRLRRFLLRLALLVLSACIAVVGAVMLIYGRAAEKYDLTKLGGMRQRSIVYDVKGREIGRLHGENRVVVPFDQVSPFFIRALLAREDARFYEHDGVDYIGVARAIARDLRDQRAVQGASTITMQLARNSYPDLNKKTAHRKLVEVMLAKRIEAAYTKDQILELYVNRIFFGSGIYGIERASKAYFNHRAAELTPGEAAMLAGIIRSPNRFSPFRNWEGAIAQRNTVLDRMVLKHLATPEEAAAAKQEDMAVAAQPAVKPMDNYMMEAVRRDLDIVLDDQEIEDGGLIIHTTVDQDLQAVAQKAVEARLEAVEKTPGYAHMTKAAFDATWDGVSEVEKPPYLQGATIAIDNRTGGILAVVGGRDFVQSRFDRATMGKRTIGSTIKPFIYTAAFMRGLMPGTTVSDDAIAPGELHSGTGHWSPQNSDGNFLGPQPAWVGLVRSRNTMTVRVGDFAGLGNVCEVLRQVGINEPATPTPQVFIGNTGTSLKALTSAMSVFPNHGIRRRPFLIDRIEDASGELIYKTPVVNLDAVPPGYAGMTERLLERVLEEGTGAAARNEYGFKGKAGGKTGTTNDYRDAWFVGFTPEVTCGVWVGLDTPKSISPGAYGGKLALPIWVDVMNKAAELGYKPTVPRADPVLNRVQLCSRSGLLATESCRSRECAYEEELTEDVIPTRPCDIHFGTPVTPRSSGNSGGGLWGRLKRLFQ